MYRRIKERPQEPEKTPFPQTPEREAPAAEAKKWIREPLAEREIEENEHPVQPELINVEFSRLATYFMRAAKNDPKLAHKKAWEFLEAGFGYFPPPPLGSDAMGARLRRINRAEDAEWRAWKLDAEPLISFAMAARADWPKKRHKSERGIVSLLKRVGYPPFCFLYAGGLINQPAYEIALQRDDEPRKERDAKRQREVRKNKGKRESPARPLQ
jgi:hypothetical protein